MLAAGAASLAPASAFAAAADPFDLKLRGNARILHLTDIHAQALPNHFREPNQNIGVGGADGRPPHIVGEAFLGYYDIAPGSRPAHALTFLDFERAARRFGPLGGMAQLKTAIDALRASAGPGRSMLLDGGDLTQGSGMANLTAGQDMIALANLLGVEAMTGHWEFTYGADGIEKLIKAFKGKFLAQNVFLTDEAAMQGKPAFDTASGRVFPPYTIKTLGGRSVAVIGQAFPYVPIAHPRRFTPDWTFGIHPGKLQALVDALRGTHKVDCVLLLSHNGMPADLKLAAHVRGIDVILGGHTHDAVPLPVRIANAGGATLVTNAGTAGKFIGVLDLAIGKGRVTEIAYRLMPIYSEAIRPDPAVAKAIAHWRAPHEKMLGEKLADVETLLYRRNNFGGTVDRMITDALAAEMDAEIVLSPGFRWGATVLPGGAFTMEDLLAETAITYPSVTMTAMTGTELKATLEDVCDNLFNRDPYLQQGGDMARLGGMRYACAPRARIGHRISAMTLANGKPIEAAKSYKVASWASVSAAQTGKPIWEVVAGHLRRAKTIRVAADDGVKLLGVAGNPGLAA
ncbi:MAG: thiosulfohydrolase SoxB [Rhodospirillales bacterium]|nr:thiosulfohydrolase SoxB [Rhodospirillales bacterium]